MNIQTLSYSQTGRPSIVDAADLVNANVTPLLTPRMRNYMKEHALRAVCDLRGQLVVRFKPTAHPHHAGDNDFGPEAA